ncbi:response regulator [Altererythrobacter sp. CC-YST694]|uniref:response regulator n=1 Tax=Altererythrobacter sp. CC-YST694 TaxID=2755038 RepID=UPI001D02C1C7|nr:response regulator [Altererythrobacter sp. CC-YST694]MCB5423786.1 response regulator [Altererythrobacter sp. CC-YST694]
MTQVHAPIEILLVEDNPADIRLTQEGLKEAKVANILHAVTNGRDALDFLHQNGAYAASPRPDLILLDLNLPGISGHQVLAEIKRDPNLLTIPVVVLTSSESEGDIVKSYEEHANCFIAKPVDFSSFLDIVSRIENFWFSIVRLPQPG